VDITRTTFDPFTTAEASRFGMSRSDLVEAVRAGVLRRVVRGVYVDARAPDTRNLRVRALELVKPPNAVACNETAAWLHGVDVFKPSERFILEPFFVVPHSTSRINRANVRCRQAYIEPDDLMRIGDITVTTPVRTVSDLLRRLYRPYALAAADAFARAGLASRAEVMQFVHRLKGYPGIVQARSLSRLIDPRAQSPGESWQRLRILDAGFPPPVPQFEVVDSLGRTWFLDHAYPELLIASEYDGTEFHTAQAHREHDEDRRGFLTEVHGWRWVNAGRSRLFGPDTAFEEELGDLLGMPPLLPRRWGSG
jgi:hypothetical protein